MNLTINPNYYQKTSNKSQNKTKNYSLPSFVSRNNLLKDTVSFRGGANSEIISELRNTIAAQGEHILASNKLIDILKDEIMTKDNMILELNKLITKNDEFTSREIKKIEDLCRKNEKWALTLMKTNDAKDLLNDKFIRPVIKEKFIKNKDLGNVNNIPTGIAITGYDDKLANLIANWATNSSELDNIHIDFNGLDQNEALNEIYSVEKVIKESRRDNIFAVDPAGNTQIIPTRRTIIHINNFEKFTNLDKNNKTIIAKLNEMLKVNAKNNKYTIIINTKDLGNVSPELTSEEHFQLKINLEDASMEF